MLISAVLMAGCGGNGLVRQGGMVTLEGEPLAGAHVTFMSTEGKPPATATTDARGEFALTTFKTGDGAFPGNYKVVITPPTSAAGGGAGPVGVKSDKVAATVELHENYLSAQKSPLVRVVPWPEGAITLPLNKDGT
jgi:hypothetical protein